MSEIANPPAAPAAPATPPAPAPAAPAAPTPFTPPAPAAGEGPDPYLESDKPFMDAIAKVDGPPPAPVPKPGAPVPKPAATVPKPGKPEERTGARVAPELRKQYETLKAEHETVKGRIPELEAKIADWERKGRDTETLQTKLADMEKEKVQLRSQLFAHDQTRDPKFIEAYQKPFNEHADLARDEIQTLKYKNDDETTRRATWDDFTAIYNAYKEQPDEAVTELRERFGAGADIAIGHFRDLTKLARMRDRAVQDLHQNSEARMKEYERQQAEAFEKRTLVLGRVNKELSERVPEYRDDPADKESTAARSKGYEMFDSEPQTAREAVLKDAHVRHRFAAYTPLRLKVARLEAELAKVKGAQTPDPDADPGGDTRRGSGGESTGKDDRTWEQEAKDFINQAQ